ncbi:hypothetical protein ACJIZ3_004882 [Penstemon smallii]|uniref:Uncharacterized protein n=1 Tax=Penstemon smallii TaxID=265156 RepID=A0ABD3S3J8_9LAMI
MFSFQEKLLDFATINS